MDLAEASEAAARIVGRFTEVYGEHASVALLGGAGVGKGASLYLSSSAFTGASPCALS